MNILFFFVGQQKTFMEMFDWESNPQETLKNQQQKQQQWFRIITNSYTPYMYTCLWKKWWVWGNYLPPLLRWRPMFQRQMWLLLVSGRANLKNPSIPDRHGPTDHGSPGAAVSRSIRQSWASGLRRASWRNGDLKSVKTRFWGSTAKIRKKKTKQILKRWKSGK